MRREDGEGGKRRGHDGAYMDMGYGIWSVGASRAAEKGMTTGDLFFWSARLETPHPLPLSVITGSLVMVGGVGRCLQLSVPQ